jgi:methyltransferase
MEQQGARRAHDPVYPWMVLLHGGTLCAAAAEVLLAPRVWPGVLGLLALAAWLGSNLLRVWVIRTLSVHWNTQVVNSAPIGVISSGPYRWVRHPNYVAVFIEMLAIPTIYGAWWTLLATTIAHILVLRLRVRSEEAVLLSNPEYLAAMGPKPRFLPRIFA